MADNPFTETKDPKNDPFAKARGRLAGAASSFETLAVEDNLGKLMLITPTAFTEKVETKFGEADAVTADAVILDADGAPKEVNGVMIFQKVMIGQLRSQIGKQPVLGRLVKQKSQKGHPAWALDSDVTEADVDAALAYLDEVEKRNKTIGGGKLARAGKAS